MTAFRISARLVGAMAPRIIQHAKRTPYTTLPGYMERFWLIPPRSLLGLPFSARVHHILRSDHDREALHDHPAASISIVLLNGYSEILPRDQSQSPADDRGQGLVTRDRPPGSIILRGARNRHRLVIPAGSSAWTIFLFMGDRSQAWGFYTAAGWVWWREYLNDWEGVDDEELDRAAKRYGYRPSLPPDISLLPSTAP